jgi:hypothetical protein
MFQKDELKVQKAKTANLSEKYMFKKEVRYVEAQGILYAFIRFSTTQFYKWRDST